MRTLFQNTLLDASDGSAMHYSSVSTQPLSKLSQSTDFEGINTKRYPLLAIAAAIIETNIARYELLAG